MRDATIADYKWLYENTNYMADGLKCARPLLLDLVELGPCDFLDYGSGRGHLADWINTKTLSRCLEYDPAFVTTPDKEVDYVLSFDVLEHIPKTELHKIFAAFNYHARKGLILTVAHMSDPHDVDGEKVELHVTIKPPGWWYDRLAESWPGATIHQRRLDSERTAFFVFFKRGNK